MHWLLLTAALAQTPIFKWQDTHGEVHFADDRSTIPNGTAFEIVTIAPRELNGLKPDPEPTRGGTPRSEWKRRFEALRQRRRQLLNSDGLTSRSCVDRASEVTVPGRPAHQQQVFIEGRWVFARIAEEPPRKVGVMVRDCTDSIVASAQAELTDAMVALRSDEAMLADQANQSQVPADWRTAP